MLLMQELGSAINDSLADADDISNAIGEIRKAGYDVFIILEATIGFNKREDSNDDCESEDGQEEKALKLKFTTQDEKFCKALKIMVDSEDKAE